jgi:hypothetical protein
VIALLFLVLSSPAPAQARWVPFETFRFQPVDEAGRNPVFLAFRDQLARAVETRDTHGLLDLVSDEIQMSIRDKAKRGKSAFIAEWGLVGAHAHESPLWDKLRETLKLGGAFEEGEFRAPYVWARWPSRFPHLDFFAVLSKSAAVHAKAEESSRTLETLTQEIVGRFDELPNPPGWKAVRAPDGVTGYVRAEDVRSPVDFRALFRREKSGWRLALFAAGDWEAHERFE